MALNMTISAAAQNAALMAVLALLDTGTPGRVRVYTGARPASPDIPPAGTLLVDLPLPEPAFATPSSGAASLAGSISPLPAVATGTGGWFRLTDAAGNGVLDGDVGTSGASALQVNTLNFVVGVQVNVLSFVLSVPTTA